MARMMRKWTGRLFAALAAAAFAVFAFEYVGVDVWSEPPTAVSASGLVTGCERLDGGLLLAPAYVLKDPEKVRTVMKVVMGTVSAS